jgi:hypothetical protein
MENAMSRARTKYRSFYQPVDEGQREALYGEYVGFLGRRNGAMDFARRQYQRREQHLEELKASRASFSGPFDDALFRRQYEKYDKSEATSPAMQLLLMFCKVNAGEAFGVEVMREARKAHFERPEAQYRAEKIIANEEEYHTKLLVGATQYFGVTMNQSFHPPLPLRVLIHGLAKTPQRFFHSVLLGAELAGIYTFSTLLDDRSGVSGPPPAGGRRTTAGGLRLSAPARAGAQPGVLRLSPQQPLQHCAAKTNHAANDRLARA